MSMPTCETTARIASGCCVMIAPISRPPFEPPMMPSLLVLEYFCSTTSCIAAKKSSNTFCLWVSAPA